MPDETADIRLVMQYMQDLVEWSSPPPPVRDEGSNVAASAYEAPMKLSAGPGRAKNKPMQ